jgi:Na+/proline symporter/nitrogen-specific signal transduction histidine kinase
MTGGGVILVASIAYLGLLFFIAWWGDKLADKGKSPIAHPAIYALSIAVYCTSWTFYGSVGRAASSGIGFLPIYLGPTLMATLGWLIIRKMARISKTHRITSIADFVSSRYGKSFALSALVTIIAVIGIMPYISLQLKAVSDTFLALLNEMPADGGPQPILHDTAFYVAAALTAFAILFGTRHIDASEHHVGMVAAIAFESLIKLVAFMAVGLFVTFWLFDGPADIFQQAAQNPALEHLFTMPTAKSMGSFVALTILSMLVVICLPRQFQVSVVENVDEDHIRRAVWMFPLYLLLINLFVLPITFAGLILFPDGQVNPDLFVLALPVSKGMTWLALFAYLGGLSAATGMIIVETVALSTMVCNDLVMPVLLRIRRLNLAERQELSHVLLAIRRWTIVIVVLMGYLYVRLIGQSFALVTIGLVSFAAAAQFAPAMLGGMYWKGATRSGALTGLLAGFTVWLYTLLLPSFAKSGWIPATFIEQGPFGFELLKPYALFGLDGFDPITHALVWSLFANLGAYIGVSLLSGQDAIERIQAALFVDAFRPAGEESGSRFWRGSARVSDLYALLIRFVGQDNAERAFAVYAADHRLNLSQVEEADADLVNYTERILAGAIGAASARVMVASVAKGEVLSLQEVMEILDEASQIIAYSQKLEAKSSELEKATADLRAANERLKELDRLKDDFVSTVTHELRTPLTSIRSFSEILHDNPNLDATQRQEFLRIVIGETERLTRLINQMLDLAKIEAGALDWDIRPIDPVEAVRSAVAAVDRLAVDKGVMLASSLPASSPKALADHDRLVQVMVNLLSNAVKFAPQGTGRIDVGMAVEASAIRITVGDNGPGIAQDQHEAIFDKFRQVGDMLTAKPQGTGLGLAISRTIVGHMGGRIWVDSHPGGGAVFSFTLKRA